MGNIPKKCGGERMRDNELKIYRGRLRHFYIWSWLILSTLFTILYLSNGALDGYVLAIFLEFVFGAIFAIIPTLIYSFFIHEK